MKFKLYLAILVAVIIGIISTVAYAEDSVGVDALQNKGIADNRQELVSQAGDDDALLDLLGEVEQRMYASEARLGSLEGRMDATTIRVDELTDRTTDRNDKQDRAIYTFPKDYNWGW